MKTQMPLVSVVIPAYNCAEFITETLESVYKQTYKNYEIIVVDDGSADGTKSALDPHMEKIRYFYQENKGTAAARNAGVEKARGELIAFLDNDDLWLPEKLELQVRALQKYPEACFVFTEGKSFDGSGLLKDSLIPKHFRKWINSHNYDRSIFLRGWIFEEFLPANIICSATSVLVKKQCLLDIGGLDEEISIGDDYDLYLRLARHYPVCLVKKCLYMWRFRENNQSGPNDDIRMFRWRKADIEVLEKNRNIIPNELKPEVNKRLKKLYWKCGWFYFNQNQFSDSRKMLFKCLRYNFGHGKAFFYLLATYLPLGIVNKIRSLKRYFKRTSDLQ